MKLFLVILLGFCAFTAKAQVAEDYKNWQNLDIDLLEDKPGYVLSLVNELIDKVKNYVEKYTTILDNQLNQLVNKFVSELLYVVDLSLADVEEQIRNIKAELISKNDNNAVACYEEYRPRIEKIYTSAKRKVENCVVHGLGEIHKVKVKVQQHIDAIKEQVSNIQDILKRCIKPFNPFYTMKCMLTNVNKIMENLKGIISNAFTALKDAGDELRAILSNSRLCVKEVVNQTEVEIKFIIKEIKHCLDHGATTTEPPTTIEPSTNPPSTYPPTYPPSTTTVTTEPPPTYPESTETYPPSTPATDTSTTNSESTGSYPTSSPPNSHQYYYY